MQLAGSVVSGTVTFTNEASAGTAALAVTGEVTLSNGDVKTFPVGTLAPGQSSVQTFTTTMGTTTLSATSTVVHDDAREQHGEQQQYRVRGCHAAFNTCTDT